MIFIIILYNAFVLTANVQRYRGQNHWYVIGD